MAKARRTSSTDSANNRVRSPTGDEVMTEPTGSTSQPTRAVSESATIRRGHGHDNGNMGRLATTIDTDVSMNAESVIGQPAGDTSPAVVTTAAVAESSVAALTPMELAIQRAERAEAQTRELEARLHELRQSAQQRPVVAVSTGNDLPHPNPPQPTPIPQQLLPASVGDTQLNPTSRTTGASTSRISGSSSASNAADRSSSAGPNRGPTDRRRERSNNRHQVPQWAPSPGRGRGRGRGRGIVIQSDGLPAPITAKAEMSRGARRREGMYERDRRAEISRSLAAMPINWVAIQQVPEQVYDTTPLSHANPPPIAFDPARTPTLAPGPLVNRIADVIRDRTYGLGPVLPVGTIDAFVGERCRDRHGHVVPIAPGLTGLNRGWDAGPQTIYEILLIPHNSLQWHLLITELAGMPRQEMSLMQRVFYTLVQESHPPGPLNDPLINLVREVRNYQLIARWRSQRVGARYTIDTALMDADTVNSVSTDIIPNLPPAIQRVDGNYNLTAIVAWNEVLNLTHGMTMAERRRFVTELMRRYRMQPMWYMETVFHYRIPTPPRTRDFTIGAPFIMRRTPERLGPGALDIPRGDNRSYDAVLAFHMARYGHGDELDRWFRDIAATGDAFELPVAWDAGPRDNAALALADSGPRPVSIIGNRVNDPNDRWTTPPGYFIDAGPGNAEIAPLLWAVIEAAIIANRMPGYEQQRKDDPYGSDDSY